MKTVATLVSADAHVGFRARLLRWYAAEKRFLPWRQTRDPYRIWVSEIMLQQTRVSAVLGHFHRFLKRFPDVRALARARTSSVLAAWSGLGYYRRARALHAAAREVTKRLGGRLPHTSEGWGALPGIGRYTASAIASIAFGERTAVVDGNVERVLSRLYGRSLSMREAWEQAEKLLDSAAPGDFNQAMMELGATVCLPGEPLCGRCPVARWCATKGALARSPAVARQRVRIAYRLAQRDGRVLLVRRPKSASLMPEMWELPRAAAPANGSALFRLRHAITVTDYEVTVVDRTAGRVPQSGRWVAREGVARLPLTGLARKILRRAQLL